MDFLEDALAALDDAPGHIKVYPDPVPGLVLHVDGDYLAYYASGNDECSTGQARLNALNIIASGMQNSGATSCVVHNTTSGCSKGERYVIATVKPYQGQRDGDRKPKNYDFMREFLMGYEGDKFAVKNWGTREADDGIAACTLYAASQPIGYCAIMTRDKDLRMLPGLHVEWLSRETVRVMPGEFNVVWRPKQSKEGSEKVYGLKWFWIQMLMGDAADHIPGLESFRTLDAKGKPCVRKMGEKTAMEFLEDCTDNKTAYEIVSSLYVNYYQTEGQPDGYWADRFCEQAALLWMRTDNKARVADFARHDGHSCISGAFCEQTWGAVARLETRVRNARDAVNNLTAQRG